jgi:hypothetical protein
MVMSFDRPSVTRLIVAAAACSVLLGVGMTSAAAAPTSDDQGYVDSTARCTTPDVAVAFGSTATSRVAICKTPDGEYTYRGVRLRDGAKLIVPASRSEDGAFVAENKGITYMVTADSLVVSAGTKVIRDDPMLDFNGPDTPQAPSVTPTTSLPPPLPAERGGN